MSLITPDELKEHLSQAQSGDDEELITSLTEGVWDLWCRLTGRSWASGAFTEHFSVPHSGIRSLVLREAPVASITSIHDDPDWAFDAAHLVDPSEYTFDPATGIVHRKYEFYVGDRSVKVVYAAGYTATTFPAGFRLALLSQAVLMFKQRKGFEGYDSPFDLEFAPDFRELSARYRRRSF